MAEQKVRRIFDKERQLAAKVRDLVAGLKPIRFNSDSLREEIIKGGKRADDLLTMILCTEDLSVALVEVIAEAETAMNTMRQALAQTQKTPPRYDPSIHNVRS